jgi:hypothetical protein
VRRKCSPASPRDLLPATRMPLVSVIVCSIDPRKFAQVTANYDRLLGGVPHEILGIHDARSLAEAYNRALDRARGELVVFSHDDIEILTPDFAARLQGHLRRYDVVGIAGTTRVVGGGWHFAGHPFDYMLVVSPHPETGKLTMVIGGGGPLVVPDIQALDGVFIAARAAVARELRFDAATFDHFHLYDLDFTYRAFLSGHRLAVCRDLVLIHRSQGNYDDRWDVQRQRFEDKHARHLAPALPRRGTKLMNVPLDDDVILNPAEVAALCRPETLVRFLPGHQRAVAP